MEGEGLAAEVPANLGVEIDRVRTAIASVLGRSERVIIQELLPTSRIRTVIEKAFQEAHRLRQPRVGTDHLLLGPLIEGEGIAARILHDLGVTLDAVRQEIDRLAPLIREDAGDLPVPPQPRRVVVLGGTRFIGRAIVAELVSCKHDLLVVHRGHHEPPDLPKVEHLHVDRLELPTVRDALKAFSADAVIDAYALTRTEAVQTIDVLPPEARLIVLSSSDVYRAYSSLQGGIETDPVPLDETAPLRTERYPSRGKREQLQDYEKLDVEEVYAPRNAIICRLPAVYGEHDYQRREEFILRRVRANRPRIPIGSGNLLFSRGYVGDIARGVRQALESEAARGQVFNFAEARTWSIALLARRILEAAGSSAELAPVKDESLLPADLEITRTARQHLLISSNKARSLLGWRDTEPEEALRRTVSWHLEHPPGDADPNFEADERALART